MRIDRCVCNNKSFREVLEEAAAGSHSGLEELLAAVCVGDRCGMCRPYIEVSLQTGQTVFTEPLQGDTT